MFTLYHNPRCSKSRMALTLITEAKVPFTVIEYLKQPLSFEDLAQLHGKMSVAAIELLRTSETEFKERHLDPLQLSNEAVFRLIADNPKLMQRPILATASFAIIGRPPENIQALLST